MRKCPWVLVVLGIAIGSTCPIMGLARQEVGSVSERIYFSALNKEEKPVLGLKPADFELRIDGKVAPLVSFHTGIQPNDRSIPIAALILLSFGPTLKSKVIEQQAGAVANALQMMNPASVLGVRLVSDRSESMVPLGHDASALRNGLQQFEERRAELNVGLKKDDAVVGNAGMVRALELAVDELDAYVESHSDLRNREVRRAIMVISAADLNPSYSLKTLYADSARKNVFVYPVFYPGGPLGPFVMDYFQLAKKTAGVAAMFGALKPGSEVVSAPRPNLNPNALDVNFRHMIRDINGKYSFTVPSAMEGHEVHLDLKCKVKGIQIRMPRTILP
jgi:hypothetical protein